MPDKVFKQRRPLIEPLEPRLLFSATLDAILLDEPPLDDLLLQNSASSVDLTQVYDTALSYQPPELGGDEPAFVPLSNTEPPLREDLAQIVFIDARVEDSDTLLAGLSGDVTVITLDLARDGVAQISEVLRQYQNLQTVHVISHGSAGALQLGNSLLNDATIEQYHRELQGWQGALGADADMLLYGCDLAANSGGVAMLARLGELTGADVAASDDVTGHTVTGGDWTLEYQQGEIASGVIVSQAAQQAWQGRLADTHYVNVADRTTFLEVSGSHNVGQQYVFDSAAATYNVNEISLSLARYQTALEQTITVELRDSWDGAILASASLSSNEISDVGFEWHSFSFADVTLNDSQSYSIRITSDADDSGVLVGSNASNLYNNATLLDGGVANVDGWDLAFKVSEEDGINAAPTIISPIPDQNLQEDAAYSYTVAANTFTDADSNDTLRFRAQLAGGGDLDWLVFNPITREFSGTPRADDIGTMSVQLIAIDNHGAEASDYFDLVISNTNDDPYVRFPISNQAATEDTPFSFTIPPDAFGDDDPGASLNYQAELAGGGALPAWLSFDSASRNFSGTPSALDIGTVEITVTADDGEGGATVQDTFELVVTNMAADAGQVFEWSPPAANGTGLQLGSDVYQSFNDSDGTGIYVVDSLSVQLRINEYALDQTEQTVTAELLDSIGGTLLATASMSSEDLQNSLSWESFAVDNLELNYGQTYFIKLSASGNTGDPLVYAGIHNQSVYGNGSYYNHNGVEDPGRDLAFEIAGTNYTPVINNPIPDQSGAEDSFFDFTFAADTFSDADNDTLTYTALQSNGGGLPPWLTFDAVNRRFFGTPGESDSITWVIDVFARDGQGGIATESFNLAIANTNDDPHVENPIPDQLANDNEVFSFTYAANAFGDSDLDTLTFSAQLAGGGALPSWLTFDAATRTFNGTPATSDVGSIDILVSADDNNGGTPASDTFTLTVVDSNDNPRLVNAIPNQIAAEDNPFFYQFAADTFADFDGDSLTYSAVLNGGGALPGWLTFDAATRTFSGTPAGSDIGTMVIAVSADDGQGGSSATATFALEVTNTNDNPVLDGAIANQTATEDAAFSFQFAANTFSDEDGDTLIYSAQLSGGASLPAWLDFDAASRTFSGTPGNSDVGILTVVVTVDDGQGGAPAIETFDIQVVNTNDDPVLSDSISNQTATQDSAFSFQFSENTFTDDDGDELTYTAQLGGGGALPAWLSFDGASRTFTGTPLNGDVGTVTIAVTATDNNGGAVASDTFDIVVNNTNDGPVVANAIADQAATEDTPFSFQLASDTFFDADGNFLSYGVQQVGGAALPAWLSYDPVSQTFSGTPLNGDVGTISVAVTASDGTADITDTFDINIINSNDNPMVTHGIVDQLATEDVAFSYQLPANTFSDEDGDTLNYSAQLSGGAALPSWLSFDATNRTFNGTPSNSDVGSLEIAVTVDDGQGGVVSDAFTLTVNNTNDSPMLDNPVADQNATEDSAFSFQLPANTFSDDDGDTLVYSARLAGGANLPAWLSFDAATRTFSGTPGNADVGSLTVEVMADDGQGGLTASDSFELVVSNTNDAPVVSHAMADQTATEDTPFIYQFAVNTFSDEDGDTLAYSAQLAGGGALPGWLSFDSATRTFSGTPANDDVAVITVVVNASDDQGGASASDSFTITVTNSNDAPILNNPIADQSATEDSAFRFQLAADTFIDDDGDSLDYSAGLANGDALPAWLSFDASERVFSGIPGNNDVGAIDITVYASDNNGGTLASDSFVITVINSNDGPVVAAPIADQTVDEDSPFSFQIPGDTFYDADGSTLTYSVQQAGGPPLPAWLTFDATTRTFTGTPENNDVGTLTLEVIASDGVASTTDSFALQVLNTNDAPLLTQALPDQVAVADNVFRYQLAPGIFNDIDGDSLRYSAQLAGGGALPEWLQFDAINVTFMGTPENGDSGDLAIVLSADDGNGASAEAQFVLTVLSQNNDPRLNNPLANQLATEGSEFLFQLPDNTFIDPDGDVLAITVTSATSWPDWLQYNAETQIFSGTPGNQDAGVYQFAVSATDGQGGKMATTVFDIVVSGVNDAPVLLNPIDDIRVVAAAELNVQLPGNTFVDPDRDVLVVSATLANGQPLPAWLTFDGATQTFSGVAQASDEGAINILVTASDGQSQATDSFVLTVTEAPLAEVALDDITVLEDSPNQTLSLGAVFNRALNSEPLSFSLLQNTNQALFDAVSIDARSGEVTLDYAANAFGSGELQIQAQSAGGDIISAAFTVTVLPVNDTPVVTPEAPTNIATSTEAHAYPVNLWGSFFDVEDGRELSYTVSSNSNPAVAQITAIDSETGVLVLATNANGGTSYITVRATDSEGAWQEHTLLIDIRVADTGTITERDDDEPAELNDNDIGVPPDRPDPTPAPPQVESDDAPIVTQTGGGDLAILGPDTLDPDPFVLPESDDLFSYDTNNNDNDRDTRVAVNDASDRQAQLREQDNRQYELIGLDPSANTHLSLQDIADFSRAVDESCEQIEQAFLEQQKQQEMIAAVSLSLGTGLILWALRASSLLFALFSVLPLWRGVDPLPILENVEKKKKQLAKQKKDRKTEDSSAGEVGYLFDHDMSARPQDHS
ncbi:putative Ig domain-containing protein [uncultured Gilvimarinus sp.]|uniref:putative Ig domain-containing protein n=1 Tax=uncultured Gilvimarinus sp. TaxID=1689143 RepID=UPI0030EF79E1